MPRPQHVHITTLPCETTCKKLMAEIHKNFHISFKLKAVEAAEKESKAAAAREFKVDLKRIREWCAQKKRLIEFKKAGKSKRKRMKGAGRRPMDEDMEGTLFQWICKMREWNLCVSWKLIKQKAKTLGRDGFKAIHKTQRSFSTMKNCS